MAFLPGPVTVEVPATSANLGPGYDCLGIALELSDTLVGRGGRRRPRGRASTVRARTSSATSPTSSSVRCGPPSRCWGSSPPGLSAVGAPTGSRTAAAWAPPRPRSSAASCSPGPWSTDGVDRLDDAQALALANRLEGHPDNVAPALLGGFVISGQAGERGLGAERPGRPVDLGGRARAAVRRAAPSCARGLLPDSVPHADAAANTGRAALLVAALGGQPRLLLRATEDFLHQRQREPAMPESLALVHELRSRGVPAVVSGAGPTVLAFVAAGVTPPAEDGRSSWPRPGGGHSGRPSVAPAPAC